MCSAASYSRADCANSPSARPLWDLGNLEAGQSEESGEKAVGDHHFSFTSLEEVAPERGTLLLCTGLCRWQAHLFAQHLGKPLADGVGNIQGQRVPRSGSAIEAHRHPRAVHGPSPAGGLFLQNGAAHRTRDTGAQTMTPMVNETPAAYRSVTLLVNRLTESASSAISPVGPPRAVELGAQREGAAPQRSQWSFSRQFHRALRRVQGQLEVVWLIGVDF